MGDILFSSSISMSTSLKEAHDLTDHLAEELRIEQPNVTLSIHVEPPKNSNM